MPLNSTTLGYVLMHIYDIDFGAGIYLPSNSEHYEADTPVIVASLASNSKPEEEALHHDCLNMGFTKWLNVAVVSDTCDDVVNRTEDGFVAAFNKDCREGGWLRKMMNYRKE